MKNAVKNQIYPKKSQNIYLRYLFNFLANCFTQNKVKGPFSLEKCPFCYVIIGGHPYFLNKTLDKVYNNQLRSCNPTNRKQYIALFSPHNIQLAETLAFLIQQHTIYYTIFAKILLYSNGNLAYQDIDISRQNRATPEKRILKTKLNVFLLT